MKDKARRILNALCDRYQENSRLLPDEVRSLRNQSYSIITPADTRTREVGDAEQLRQILVDDLGCAVSDSESRRLFEKVVARTPE